MSEADKTVDETKTPVAEDLDLIDPALEDESKTDDQLWDELEAAEEAAGPDDESGAAAEAAASGNSDDKTGDEGTATDDKSGEKSPDSPATPADTGSGM